MIYNITSQPAGQSASYEDLWRLTLVNYYAGPGCLGNAIQAAKDSGKPLDWPNVSGQLAGVCKQASEYIEEVSQEK